MVLDVVAFSDFDVVSVIIAQDLQCRVALVGQCKRAPLLHAWTVRDLAIAVFCVIRLLIVPFLDILIEHLINDLGHRGIDVAVLDECLVEGRGIGDVKIIALARIPFSIDAVEGQRGLRPDVGLERFIRPGRIDL